MEKKQVFDVAENLGRGVEIGGTPYTVKIENYWPDFRIQDGKPGSVTDRPNNPAVLVTIRGRGVPATENSVESTRETGTEFNVTGGPPAMPSSGADVLNHLTLFVADDAESPMNFASRKNGKSSGKIDMSKTAPDRLGGLAARC